MKYLKEHSEFSEKGLPNIKWGEVYFFQGDSSRFAHVSWMKPVEMSIGKDTKWRTAAEDSWLFYWTSDNVKNLLEMPEFEDFRDYFNISYDSHYASVPDCDNYEAVEELIGDWEGKYKEDYDTEEEWTKIVDIYIGRYKLQEILTEPKDRFDRKLYEWRQLRLDAFKNYEVFTPYNTIKGTDFEFQGMALGQKGYDAQPDYIDDIDIDL